jgi:transposase
MRGFGELDRIGVEGTGTYGVSLARHLRTEQVTVVEVMRPNRQVRRRHGKTDVVDAIAAARAVLSGEANATPKTHDGPVEALRTLKVLQRNATKARTQALNQIRALLVTAAEELRARLRDLSQRELLATCAAFRIGADDDSLAAVTRFALRELAQRALFLAERLEQVKLRLKRMPSTTRAQLRVEELRCEHRGELVGDSGAGDSVEPQPLSLLVAHGRCD